MTSPYQGQHQPDNSPHSHSPQEAGTGSKNKLIRVWMDGSFDMLHVGHISAMYKGRAQGDILVVGAQSDDDVKLHKGPPVYPQHERFRLIQALRCVDQFAGAASYGTSVETLDTHACDFCVHGDDATLRASDTDPVKQLIKIHRAKLIPRSIGPSTTNYIERILRRTEEKSADHIGLPSDKLPKDTDDDKDLRHELGSTSMIVASQLRVFLDTRAPQPDDVVVYVDGAFDLFNVGHLSFLEQAAQQGTYLLVGLHNDFIVTARKGQVYPVQSLMERGLVVNSLKCVSDVIFGAPLVISDEVLDTFKIDVVCLGKLSVEDNLLTCSDRYAIPKKRGIFRIIESGSDVTTESIVSRIVKRRAEFVARNKKKFEKEDNAARKLWEN